MARGGLHAYMMSRDLLFSDPPFSALIFAAMRKADSENSARLRSAFPELWDEFQIRYDAPGGRLPEEQQTFGDEE